MAANAKTLGELHEAVAKALSEQVEGYTEQTDDGERLVRPSPAVLGAAIAFLKNNNITADPETNEALRDLNTKLADRRKRKIPQASLDAAANDFAERFGSTLQ